MKKCASSLLRRCCDGSAVFEKKATAKLTGDLAWNRFGIRDPSLLLDMDGSAILDQNGRLTLFFNARDCAIEDGGVTSVGIANGNHESGWSIRPMPVFVDGPYAAQGSVLQLAPDHFRMYYSPDTLRGFALASSTDGETWKKFGEQLILETSAFGIRRMGLPFVRRVKNQWVMLFEGIDNGRFHLYMALSPDGVRWKPANDGRPIYVPPPDSWDSFGQANPSLYVEQDGEGGNYYILYNGCSVLHGWDIGILMADALEGPWQGRVRPSLCRGAQSEWDSGRIEGARLLDMPGSQPEIVYFGLPGEDSYAGGQLAFASIGLTEDASLQEENSAMENADAERSFNDRLADRYFDIWDNYPIQRFTTEIESRMMADIIPSSSRVLLLGSGGARELPALLESCCRVTAVDISPQMLAIGKARYPDAEVDWIEADLHDLPDDLVGFDAAVCLGAVFNYLRDPSQFLANVHRALKPGGILIVAVINARHPSEVQARTEMPDKRVRQLYDLAMIRNQLAHAGFSLVSNHGVRFFVDLLPRDWNRGLASKNSLSELLEKLLELEKQLTEYLPTEQGKFILIHAVATASYGVQATDA